MHFNKADHYLGFYELFILQTRENIYLISDRAAPTNLGSWGGAGDLWGLGILTLFSFEAKISEKSEKRGSEYLKRTSESHVKRISVRLQFALKRKKNLSETGAPQFEVWYHTVGLSQLESGEPIKFFLYISMLICMLKGTVQREGSSRNQAHSIDLY